MEADNNVNFVIEAIKYYIHKESEKLIEEKIKGIKEELEQRTPEIIAGITVDIMKTTDMQVLQDRIIFTIRKK